MNKCKRYGLNVTKRCNWKCSHCFYKWDNDFNLDFNKSLNEAIHETIQAQKRGCNHVVLIGWGEPGMWPHLTEWIKAVKEMGMTSSMITNGSLSPNHYTKCRDAGMDHLHLSMHGLGTVLDEISGVYGAGERQLAVIEWLSKEEWPWRMNMTLQQKNYEHINEVAAFAVNHGCRHVVALGFLPHYGWGNLDRPRAIAVHPAALRPYLDSLAEAIEIHNAYWAENQKLYLTIRYHPMCHINPKNRKYITNAKYVVYDPGEWEYDSVHLDEEALWSKAKELAGVGKHDGQECFVCGLRIHCGAWNANMINLFDGAGLSCVQTSEEENVRGYFHDQNPFNTEFKGWFE